jgi:hypothetical protein
VSQASSHDQRAVTVRDRPRVLALGALGVLSAAALGAALLVDGGAASALPALLLPVLLLGLRRYPGERALTILAGAARTGRPRPRSSARPARVAPKLLPRGGMLLARSLAVRPPPIGAHAAA